jgi:hypothetical protein
MRMTADGQVSLTDQPGQDSQNIIERTGYLEKDDQLDRTGQLDNGRAL